jgi:heme ABC exporter ATP-binding subunit CcmA
LVRDEQQDQEPERHQRAADARDHSAHRSILPANWRFAARGRAFVDSPDIALDSEQFLSRVVRLRSAVCMLGRFPALAGADLDVDEGERVLLSGPNGAGKTTLLRLCAGLLPLRAGSAEVFGVDLTRNRRSMRRQLALVGHETFCYDDLTVAENLRFAARAAGGTPSDADAALERVGLERVADTTHARLSQGQRRRVALANALARRPRLLLLDEPHAGLDEHGRKVLDDVVRAASDDGCTVLLASHELDLARDLVTREVHVVAGQVHEKVHA